MTENSAIISATAKHSSNIINTDLFIREPYMITITTRLFRTMPIMLTTRETIVLITASREGADSSEAVIYCVMFS